VAVADAGAAGAPAGQGKGEDEVVVFAAFVRVQVDHLADQSVDAGHAGGDAQFALFEGDLEGGEEVLFGDGGGAVRAGLAFAAGDGDGHEFAVESGGAEEIDYGSTYARSVDDDCALARERVSVGDGSNRFDDSRIGGAQRDALGPAYLKFERERRLGVVSAIAVFGDAFGSFDDDDRGVVVLLAKVDTDVEHIWMVPLFEAAAEAAAAGRSACATGARVVLVKWG